MRSLARSVDLLGEKGGDLAILAMPGGRLALARMDAEGRRPVATLTLCPEELVDLGDVVHLAGVALRDGAGRPGGAR